MAIWVTAGSFVVLIFLTFDTVKQITAGGKRVPAYSVINHRVDYVFDEARNIQVPVIGAEEPLFGKKLTEEEAEAMVSKGKLTTQAKNCMGCHTLLGNGSYYAPDLTKSWLDRSWGSKEVREQSMVEFLMNPTDKSQDAESGYYRRRSPRHRCVPEVDVVDRHQRLPGQLPAHRSG
jgi:nitric oxide reductase subunit C